MNKGQVTSAWDELHKVKRQCAALTRRKKELTRALLGAFGRRRTLKGDGGLVLRRETVRVDAYRVDAYKYDTVKQEVLI